MSGEISYDVGVPKITDWEFDEDLGGTFATDPVRPADLLSRQERQAAADESQRSRPSPS